MLTKNNNSGFENIPPPQGTTPSKTKPIDNNNIYLSSSSSQSSPPTSAPTSPIMRQQLNNRNKKVASDWSKKKKDRTAMQFLTLIVCLTMMLCCSFYYVIIPNHYFSSTRMESNIQLSHDIPIDDKDSISSGSDIVARRIKGIKNYEGSYNIKETQEDKTSAKVTNNIDLNKIINKINTETSSATNATKEAPGLAACILIKDENHNLDEWIAYHYLTLPLRYLVVTTDPSSETSPSAIFDKWNNADLGLTIVTWNDTRFMPIELRGNLPDNATFLEMRDHHRERQNRFYGQCLRYLRNNKLTWTLLIDVDEFLVFNHAGYGEKHFVKNTTNASSQYQLQLPFPNGRNMTRIEQIVHSTMLSRTNLPTTIGKPTFSEFINTNNNGPNKMAWLNRRCLTMARLTFGNMEEPSQDKLHNAIPSEFDPTKFNTLRYFRHATKGLLKENKYGKTMIDVSRIAHSSVTQKTRQVHTPVIECGNMRSANPPYNISLFRVNHYASSPEAFFAKSDRRRTVEAYEWRSTVNNGTIYDIQPWLSFFVQKVGLERALILLKDAGNLDELLSIRNRTTYSQNNNQTDSSIIE